MTTSLENHFLIAMPAMQDPNFHHGVVFVCEHTDEGGMGVLINQPLDIQLQEVFAQMDVRSEHETVNRRPVMFGGPVQPERGFVLHRPSGTWDSSLEISEKISVTTSQDILKALASEQGPEDYLVALGYTGWGAGQIEEEIVANAWLSGPVDPAIIFDTPIHERWQAAAALLGVDITGITGTVGHA